METEARIKRIQELWKELDLLINEDIKERLSKK